ncbi:MAG: SGNH/GDSL hydrolase family protein [Bacteroidota bacterium]
MSPAEKRLFWILSGAFCLNLFLIGWMAPWIVENFPFSPYRVFGRIGLIGINLLLLLRILHLILVKSDWAERAKRRSLIFGALFFIGLIVEVPFMFIAHSHGNGSTYAARVWFHRYWEFNSDGYRAPEFNAEAGKGKFKIGILGDSFVAGHGINDPEERFSNILQRKLGDGFKVYNIGVCGADTKDELGYLEEFPAQPDLVVLCHLPNDIERVTVPEPEKKPVGAGLALPGFLTRASFFLNYMSWKMDSWTMSIGSRNEQTKPEDFTGNNPVAMYFEPGLREAHYEDLDKIVQWCREKGTRLMVLTFPETYKTGIEFTQTEINMPLATWMESREVPTLHAYDVLRPIPEEERIVNLQDAHPSPKSHAAVAEMLLQYFQEQTWMPPISP